MIEQALADIRRRDEDIQLGVNGYEWMSLTQSGANLTQCLSDRKVLVAELNALTARVAELEAMATKMRDDERYYGGDYTDSMRATDRRKLLEACLAGADRERG